MEAKKLLGIPYEDLAGPNGIEEDARIAKIGDYVMAKRLIAAVLVDDEAGKADRYITKLQKQFPGIREISRSAGPVAGVITLKIGPPLT